MNCDYPVRLPGGFSRIFLSVRRLALFLATMAFGLLAVPAFAAPAATGSVTGSVLNAASGKYASKALVTVENTAIQALTDDFGTYRLDGVPAGKVRVKAYFTGQPAQVADVTVVAGQTATQDFTLGRGKGAAATVTKNGAVVLDQYVVQANRFKNAQEIAINEERNSINIKNVVAADAFGDVAEGNVAEFVKYLPGVLINYGGQSYTSGDDATSINVRGFGPDLTAITVDGMPISSSQPGSLTNAVTLSMLSINNASRIELTKVPTPDMPADSPGGSINLVSKNAFEYAKPTVDWRLYGSMNSEDTKLLSREPGPGGSKTFHTLPGADFTYADPLTKDFGITVTGASSNEFNENHRIQDKYVYSGSSTNLAGQKNYVNNPFMGQLQATDGPRDSFRQSGSVRADWRPTPGQVLSLTYQLSFYNSVDSARRLQLQPGNVTDWGPDYTIGKVNSGQSGAQTTTNLDSGGRTQYGQLRYTLDKGPWQIGAAFGHSVSNGSYKSAANGHFSEVDMDLNNVGQVIFKNMNLQTGVPGSITVLDKSGNPINYGQLTSYGLSGLNSGTFTALAGSSYQQETVNTYKVDVQRDLDFIPPRIMSLSVKVGYYRKDDTQNKSGNGTNWGYQYVGPTTAFDISQYLDDNYKNISPGFGLPTMQWVDPYKTYKFFEANPQYFSSTSDSTVNGKSIAANNYASYANQQIGVTTTNEAYYAMLTGRFFHNRLSMIAGARQERGSIRGNESLNNKKWNYLKNPNGSIYQDSKYPNGVLLTSASAFNDAALQSRLAAAGITFNHVVDPNSLEAAMLQYTPFAPIHASITGRVSPDASFAYTITKKLVARFGWARTYAPPDLQSTDIGGTAGLVARTTFNANNGAGSFPAGTITISNPNLKPWSADNYDLSLSYYTDSGGSFSVDYYLKFIKNFWISNSVILDQSNYATVLDTVGLVPDPQYIDWQVNTSTNGVGTGRTNGYEFNAQQSLGILGNWGKPFYVFADFTTSKVSQNQTDGALAPTSKNYGSAGVSFSWKRVSLIVKATHQTKNATQSFTGSYYDSTGAKQTLTIYQYQPAVTRVDVNFNYQLTSKLSLFADARNVTNTKLTMQQYDQLGIWPAYAQNYDTRDFGVQIIFGIRGTF